MSRLSRILSRKGWTQPPFWSLSAPIFASSAGDKERIEEGFEAYVHHAYKRNGIVFACILVRQLVFSEARFQWQRLVDGRPSEMFGDQHLAILERPWRNGTTGELLARMEQDTSLAGNFYATPVGTGSQRRLRRMRPDWVTIVTGVRKEELTSPDEKPSPFDLRAEPIAYIYEPRVGVDRPTPVILTPDQVIHWSPIPDPEAQWRGMSWLTPVINEVQADSAATRHKQKFFENGAMPGLVVSYDAGVSPEAFAAFVESFKKTEGAQNAYKTLHLGGGADVKATAADLKQLDFKVTQGAGETRIAAAAGVHPVIAGLSEGMQGSSLNAGNFQAARRRFADGTVRPNWRSACAAIEPIVPRPPGAVRLWYDDRDVPFLREDAKEAAQIRREDANTIEALVRAGFTPESSRDAVISADFRRLSHTGLFSVQLQPPGSVQPPSTEETA